jgi:hypothetical protein
MPFGFLLGNTVRFSGDPHLVSKAEADFLAPLREKE